MYRVRCYRGSYHPDVFRVGVVGWLIFILNHLRWWLERGVDRLSVRFFSKVDNIGETELGNLRQVLDLQAMQERIERIRTSPKFPADSMPLPNAEEDPRLTSRFASKSWGTGIDGMMGDRTRPAPLDDVIRRYGAPKKQQRYAMGESVIEEEFEPLPGKEAK